LRLLVEVDIRRSVAMLTKLVTASFCLLPLSGLLLSSAGEV